MTHNTRIIVFTGPKSSGKDTAAKYLLARNSLLRASLFQQQNFADPLKNACAAIFGLTPTEMSDMPFKEQELNRWPGETPRTHLIKVAKMFRTFYGGDVFVKRWEEIIKQLKTECVVVTDLRHTEELDSLKARNAIIIYVQNDVAEAKLRELKEAGDFAANDASEASYELMRAESHAVITNNGSIDELHTQVSVVAKELLGDWTLWGQMEPVKAL